LFELCNCSLLYAFTHNWLCFLVGLPLLTRKSVYIKQLIERVYISSIYSLLYTRSSIICSTDLKMIVEDIKELEFDIHPNTIQFLGGITGKKGYDQIPMRRQSWCHEEFEIKYHTIIFDYIISPSFFTIFFFIQTHVLFFSFLHLFWVVYLWCKCSSLCLSYKGSCLLMGIV